MNDRAQAFNDAWDAFAPDATDSPDAIPFYRAFAGLRAAWGEDFCSTYNAAVHHAAGYCQGEPPEQQYAHALQTLRLMVDHKRVPEKPYESCQYACRPAQPTDHEFERAARQTFNVQFKNRFPGERAGSKHANALWLTVRDKALKIVRERHADALQAWEAEDASIRDHNEARRQDWLDKLHNMALFEDAVRGLAKE